LVASSGGRRPDAAALVAWMRGQAADWRRREGLAAFPHAGAVANFYLWLADEIADATGPKMRIITQHLLPPGRRPTWRRVRSGATG
jgi:hypothetical protein